MNEPAQVILYSKPGCHLCDEMKAEIAKANCAGLYELQEINIETNAELFARYRNDIPVLSINGAEAFRHRVTSKDFRDYLSQPHT
jgi:glutaredoxin